MKTKNFLKKRIDLPFNSLIKHIKNKRITLNGKKIKEESILREGDIIKVWLDEIKLREVKKNFVSKKDLGIDVIFENEDFLVLNKLAGIVVQGAQEDEESLSLHLAYLKDKNKDTSDFEYFHVHRIDKDTSGILVCAKNRVALRELNKIFRLRDVVKKYLCLSVGSFNKDSGEIKLKLQRNPSESREKVSVNKGEIGNFEWVKNSISKYRVLKEFMFNSETYSLVEVEIETGVTHQIRVQMKYLNHPIVGDKMYGNSFVNDQFKDILNRHFLHASIIEFEYNGKKYSFEAPFTSDLENCLDKIRDL